MPFARHHVRSLFALTALLLLTSVAMVLSWRLAGAQQVVGTCYNPVTGQQVNARNNQNQECTLFQLCELHSPVCTVYPTPCVQLPPGVWTIVDFTKTLEFIAVGTCQAYVNRICVDCPPPAVLVCMKELGFADRDQVGNCMNPCPTFWYTHSSGCKI